MTRKGKMIEAQCEKQRAENLKDKETARLQQEQFDREQKEYNEFKAWKLEQERIAFMNRPKPEAAVQVQPEPISLDAIVYGLGAIAFIMTVVTFI